MLQKKDEWIYIEKKIGINHKSTIAIAIILVSIGEAITTIATITQPIATTTIPVTAMITSASGSSSNIIPDYMF